MSTSFCNDNQGNIDPLGGCGNGDDDNGLGDIDCMEECDFGPVNDDCGLCTTQCMKRVPATCGDDVCESDCDEDIMSCPQDCCDPTTCGNGECEPECEDKISCPKDCLIKEICGDNILTPNEQCENNDPLCVDCVCQCPQNQYQRHLLSSSSSSSSSSASSNVDIKIATNIKIKTDNVKQGVESDEPMITGPCKTVCENGFDPPQSPCGNGEVEEDENEQCEPESMTDPLCDNHCQCKCEDTPPQMTHPCFAICPRCGNGEVEDDEDCDPPEAPNFCLEDCSCNCEGSPPPGSQCEQVCGFCGDGMINGLEECEPYFLVDLYCDPFTCQCMDCPPDPEHPCARAPFCVSVFAHSYPGSLMNEEEKVRNDVGFRYDDDDNLNEVKKLDITLDITPNMIAAISCIIFMVFIWRILKTMKKNENNKKVEDDSDDSDDVDNI